MGASYIEADFDDCNCVDFSSIGPAERHGNGLVSGNAFLLHGWRKISLA